MLAKDLTVEARRGYEVLASVGFVLTASLVVAQAAQSVVAPLIAVAGVWVILLFAAVFASTTTFVREVDKRTIYGLRSSPLPPRALFLAKDIFTLLLLLSQGALELVVVAVMANEPALLTPASVLVLVLFSAHVAAVSAFVSAIVMYSEGRSFLIPMLVIVLAAPVVPLAVQLVIAFDMWSAVLFASEAALMTGTAALLSEYLLAV
jgi:ABC-type transport system involved in cytochrome c biogenesis permease component